MGYYKILLLSVGVQLPTYAYEISENLNIEPTARYRFQDVNDQVQGNAQASTLKLRLSADWQINDSWQSFTQFDYVHAFNEGDYNSVTVQRATSPILDPPGKELNQLFVKYTSNSNWSATLGKQSVGFDNERHVGKIEFWQHDQTFDALRFEYQDHLNWSVNYLYLDQSQRVFGDEARTLLSPEDIRFKDNPMRPYTERWKHNHDSHLLNVKYTFSRQFEAVAYAYLLDNKTTRIFSSDTYGVKLSGEVKPEQVKYGYLIEYARQSSTSNNPWVYTADYLMLEASAQYKSHQFSLNYEKLGDDNGFGFATSLGTNHKFQGWADIFSGYLQRGGMEDISAGYRGRDGKLRWRLVLHQFEDTRSGSKVGDELDLEIAYRYTRDWEFKFIGSLYFASNGIDRLPASQKDLSTFSVSAAYNF